MKSKRRKKEEKKNRHQALYAKSMFQAVEIHSTWSECVFAEEKKRRTIRLNLRPFHWFEYNSK